MFKYYVLFFSLLILTTNAQAEFTTVEDCKLTAMQSWNAAVKKKMPFDAEIGSRVTRLMSRTMRRCTKKRFNKAETSLKKLSNLVEKYDEPNAEILLKKRKVVAAKKRKRVERAKKRRARFKKAIALVELATGSKSSATTEECETRFQSLIEHAHSKSIDEEVGEAIEPLGEKIEQACENGRFKKADRLMAKVAKVVQNYTPSKPTLPKEEIDVIIKSIDKKRQKVQ